MQIALMDPRRASAPGSQRLCPHPSARWVHGACQDRRVCERCGAVLDEGWPDHHPEISRWLNEGGAVRPSTVDGSRVP